MNVGFDNSHPVERFLRGKSQLAEAEGLISSILNTECDHFWDRDSRARYIPIWDPNDEFLSKKFLRSKFAKFHLKIFIRSGVIRF